MIQLNTFFDAMLFLQQEPHRIAQRFCANRDTPEHRVHHTGWFPVGTPNYASASGPDILVNTDSNFLKQQITKNGPPRRLFGK
jgi:hypothetical protein